MRRRVALGAALLLWSGACGEELVVEGTPGAPIEARLDAWVPAVPVGVDRASPASFLVDTGAPVSMLDRDSFPGRPEGVTRADLEAFELTFRDRELLVFDVFPYEQPPDRTLDGIVGGDVLRHFAVTVDYQIPRVWLEDAPDALPAGVSVDAVGERRPVPASVRGGGEARVPGDCPDGCGTVDLDRTRFLVEVLLEDEGTRRWLLVDTGATAVVLDAAVAAALPDAARPRLSGVTVGTAAGAVEAYYTRLARLEVAGGPSATGTPVLVLPDESLFDGLSEEVGVRVDGLLGASFLRGFLTTVDYPGETLILAPYADTRHIDPNEFVRVGFTMTRRDDAWTVQDVYPGTDAAAEGLMSGDRIAELDDTPIAGLGAGELGAILGRFRLGDEVPVGLNRGAGIEVVLVRVEDLLPAYP